MGETHTFCALTVRTMDISSVEHFERYFVLPGTHFY
jgi:hypothetical protein